MVSKEYAGVLDGIIYADKIIYEGEHWDLDGAIDQAEADGGEIVVVQVNGPRESVMANTYKGADPKTTSGATSFAKESWRVAGRLHEWDNCWPLVIDSRSPEREAKLLADCLPRKAGRKKKLMLVSLGGNSSPFPYRQLLMLVLKFAFEKEYQIIELPKAERIYDLLALYEKASVLIATDSAPLHLAWACRSLPVFALVNDKPLLWHGSPWKPNHHWYCRYHDFPDRASEMVEGLEKLPEFIYDGSSMHVWSEYESKRMLQFAGMPFPIKVGMCGRDSQLVLQDHKRVPYLKDVIRMAMQKCATEDTEILLSRPDTEINTKQWCKPPFYAYRITHGETDKFSPICDLFMASKSFWKSILPEIPDVFLCGDALWSQALWSVFKAYGAADATGMAIREETPPKIQAESKTRTHNWDIVIKSPMLARYPAVADQLETLKLDTRHMMLFGYNPTLLKTPQGFNMVYRYHEAGSNTALGVAEFDILGNFQSGGRLHAIKDKSLDDAKYFQCNGQTLISWVESNYPLDLKAVVKYAPISGGLDLGHIKTFPFDGNDGSTCQKNYLPFDKYCIYACSPKHLVYEHFDTSSDVAWCKHETESPRWAYGEIRGGTPPVPYEGKLLRFFHSSLRNEFASTVAHRYYIGCYLMEDKPPFKVVRVCKKPILFGSELDSLTTEQRTKCFHRKVNVVFPNGLIEAKDSWLLSSGANDCEIVLSIVRPKDLNL